MMFPDQKSGVCLRFLTHDRGNVNDKDKLISERKQNYF